jgi:hypothetical protein
MGGRRLGLWRAGARGLGGGSLALLRYSLTRRTRTQASPPMHRPVTPSAPAALAVSVTRAVITGAVLSREVVAGPVFTLAVAGAFCVVVLVAVPRVLASVHGPGRRARNRSRRISRDRAAPGTNRDVDVGERLAHDAQPPAPPEPPAPPAFAALPTPNAAAAIF